METLHHLQTILSNLPASSRDFLLHPPELPHLTLALSSTPRTYTHTIATQSNEVALPDTVTQTLSHTLPSSNLGFQVNLRAATQATFRTLRDDRSGLFIRVANCDDTLHIACIERLSGAVRKTCQAFLTADFMHPIFVFQSVEVGACPRCGCRGLCDCVCDISYDGMFEGIGRAVWHNTAGFEESALDVITRSHVIENTNGAFAKGLQQMALGECMITSPISITRLSMPTGRRIAIAPAEGTAEQVVQHMNVVYEQETKRKIEERKMRNRRAAVQSNVKKKLMIEKMKKDLDEEKERKTRLEMRVVELRMENQELRTALETNGLVEEIASPGQ